MSTPVATVDELATYLGLGTGVDQDIDVDKAALILQLAHDKCEQIVSPVPAAAKGVELDVAGRAYMNPSNVTTQDGGPYGYPPSGTTLGGLWLTRMNIAELRRLSPDASGSGAFTIDPTPADAGPGNFWSQYPLATEDSFSGEWVGDWDWPPVSA